MDGPATDDPEPALEELFRHSKRRKVYRKRMEEADGDDEESAAVKLGQSLPPAAPEPMTVDELISRGADETSTALQAAEETQLSVQDIIRQRKAAQRRKAGIEFSNHASPFDEPASGSDPTREGDEEDAILEDIKKVVSRFTPQTGQVTDENNKHMLAYIDSEIAKMHRQKERSSSDYNAMNMDGREASKLPSGRQPAAIGRLHEIDLGPDSKARNIARTEAAQRRLDGQSNDEEDEKPRLRRNGKPFRRKRRTSTDIKRDKLVEEVMRESRLEIYDDEEAMEGNDDEGAADDMIAEQFRRDFMDAVSNRRRRRAPAAAAKGKGKVVQTESRGPKLGGSRSARAKLREKELEEAAKGKKR